MGLLSSIVLRSRFGSGLSRRVGSCRIGLSRLFGWRSVANSPTLLSVLALTTSVGVFFIGPYIVDIACRSAKLALEFDGAQHQDTVVYDAVRTAFLKDRGWTVLRFWNGEMFSNLEGVLTVILNATAECLGGTHPQPLPSREGRRKAP